MSGFAAVYWKDLRELLFGGGRQTASVFFSLGLLVLLSVFQSFATQHYTSAVFTVLFISALSFAMTIVSFTADAVAGERERHTLETLLSLPVSGAQLYWGKLAAMLTIGLVTGLLVGFSGTLVVTALFGAWDRLLFTWLMLLGFLTAGLIMGFLLGTVGLVVSARARTVQQAGMILALAMLPIMFIVVGIPAFAVFASVSGLGSDLTDPTQMIRAFALALVITLAAIVALIAGLIVLGLRLFSRPRLMLS